METAVTERKKWIVEMSIVFWGLLTLIFGVEYMPAYLAGGLAGAIWGVGGFFTTKAQGVWKSIPLRVSLIVATVLASGAVAHFFEDWLH